MTAVDEARPTVQIRAAVPPFRAGLRSSGAAVLVAVLGGVLTALAFPPVGAWPLAAVGPGLLVVAVVGRRPVVAFGLGTVFGLAYFAPLLSWLVNLGWLPWTALVVVQSLFLGAHGVLVRLLLQSRWWPVTVGASWVVVEAVRGAVPLGGFPWRRLAFSQVDSPALPWVRLGGVPLLTLLTALAGTALAAAVLQRRARAGVWVALAVAVGLGATLVPPPAASGREFTVAVVQGNVPRERTLAEQVRLERVSQNHAAATRRLAAEVRAGRVPAPDLVVWPENSTDTDPRDDPQIRELIAGAVRDIGRPVLVGAILDEPEGRVFNSGQLWLPERGPVAAYAKRQLVPFGEYVPFRDQLGWVEQLQLIPRNLTAGSGDAVLPVAGTRIGGVICYEVAYDDLVRSSVATGAQLLVVQTNNATYMRDGQLGETLQQLDMARVRAVEHDRAAVVASTTGISAIIAPDGSLTVTTGPWRSQVLVGTVELRETPPRSAGPWVEPLAAAVVLGVLVPMVARRRGGRVEVRPWA